MVGHRTAITRRREELGLTQQDIADRLGVHLRTWQRCEDGETTLRVGQRPRLAEILQTSPQQIVAWLNGQAEARLLPGWFGHYLTLEQSAASMRTWEPILVPGLLQTEAYAAALAGNSDVIEVRLERQYALTHREPRLQVTAVLDESVLHRPIGGQDVLRDQVVQLAEMAALPNVDLRVMPLDAETHPLAFGALVVLEMDGYDVVYQENRTGAVYLDQDWNARPHVAAYDQLASLAFSSGETLGLLERRIKDL